MSVEVGEYRLTVLFIEIEYAVLLRVYSSIFTLT